MKRHGKGLFLSWILLMTILVLIVVAEGMSASTENKGLATAVFHVA